MSRNTFQLIMLMCVLAFSATIVSVYFIAYGLMGVIEPEAMFGKYEWGSLFHNECYCRHRKPSGFGRDGRESPPRSFSADVTRERVAALRVARERVRNEYLTDAALACLGLLSASIVYAFLLWRLRVYYRPRPDGTNLGNSNPFRGYLWYMFVLSWIGLIGCTVGSAYGAFVVLQPDSRVSITDLDRCESNEEYWAWIGQGLDVRHGMVDIHKRPSDEELTRARLAYWEVEREQQRALGRLIILVSIAGWLTFGILVIVHRRLIMLLRSWRTSNFPSTSQWNQNDSTHISTIRD